MSPPTRNFLVDSLAFAGFVLLTATGILLHYLLPPGSGHRMTIWGLDRHDWGRVHFWISVAFLGSLALHLVLHWKWVAYMVRGRPQQGTDAGARVGLGLVGLVALLALAVAPLLSPIETTSGAGGGRAASPKQSHRDRPRGEATIRGSMTLRKVERATGVPVADLVRQLGLPPDVSADERLGQLRQAHGFSLEDVRRIVREHQPKD